MRDRLVELIKQANKKCASTDKCEDCSACDTGDEPDDCLKYNIADHLLANGVIVPQCKVGDIIYLITYNRKDYMPIKVPSLESLVRWMDEDRFGYDLFLTREEAEQALKGDHQ